MKLGEVRYCPQCGKIVGKTDRFCRHCGLATDLNSIPPAPARNKKKILGGSMVEEQIESKDKEVIKRATKLNYQPAGSKRGKEQFNKAEANMAIKPKSVIVVVSWIILGVALLFLIYFVAFFNSSKLSAPDGNNMVAEESSSDSKDVTGDIESTNPAYLLAPETYVSEDIVDTEETAPDGQTVWVEDIIDENTIKISYTEHAGNKNRLSFSLVDLAGLSDFSYEPYYCNPEKMTASATDTRLDEAREAIVRFLEKNLQGKFLTLETPASKPDCHLSVDSQQIKSESLERYAYMSVDDIDAKYAVQINGIENNHFNVSRALIDLGYAKLAKYRECYFLFDVFVRDEAEAEENSRGAWADCLFYYQ